MKDVSKRTKIFPGKGRACRLRAGEVYRWGHCVLLGHILLIVFVYTSQISLIAANCEWALFLYLQWAMTCNLFSHLDFLLKSEKKYVQII